MLVSRPDITNQDSQRHILLTGGDATVSVHPTTTEVEKRCEEFQESGSFVPTFLRWWERGTYDENTSSILLL